MSTTYFLSTCSGFVTKGQLGLTEIPEIAAEIWTGHTFESALHQLKSHPELGPCSFPRTTDHVNEEVVGCYGCYCDDCERDHEEQQASEIEAENAWLRAAEAPSLDDLAFEHYEISMGLVN